MVVIQGVGRLGCRTELYRLLAAAQTSPHAARSGSAHAVNRWSGVPAKSCVTITVGRPLDARLTGCVVSVEQQEDGLHVAIDGSRADEADEQVVTLRFHANGATESRDLRVAFLAGSTDPSIAAACVVVTAHLQPNTAAEGRARVDVVVPIGGCVKGWDSPSGATATMAELRPVPGGVAVGYDLVWPRRKSQVSFVVRDQLGVEQVLRADLVVPSPISR